MPEDFTNANDQMNNHHATYQLLIVENRLPAGDLRNPSDNKNFVRKIMVLSLQFCYYLAVLLLLRLLW